MEAFKIRFVPEWCALAAVALLDLAWAQAVGLRVLMQAQDFMAAAGALGLLAAALAMRAGRAALVLEFFCLSATATILFCILSYLAMATTQVPLLDAPMMAADWALGFDWKRLYYSVTEEPLLAIPLQLAYASVAVQGLVAGIALSLTGRQDQLRDLFRLIAIASFITCISAMFFPALGPYKIFEIAGRGAFLPDMEHLLSRQDLTFTLSQMTGVISFPSFHTVLALAYAWGMRRTGWLGHAMLALNLAMLVAIPVYGGHYLVDVIAGAMVFALAAMLVRALRIAKRPLMVPAPAPA